MPLTGGILVVAALLASPALWASFVDGTMAIEDALIRYLIAVAVAWVGLSAFASLLQPAAPVDRASAPEDLGDSGPG